MKKLMKYLVGDVEEKRAWRRAMKRVATLPADYRFVYEKIVAYIWSFAAGATPSMWESPATVRLILQRCVRMRKSMSRSHRSFVQKRQ